MKSTVGASNGAGWPRNAERGCVPDAGQTIVSIATVRRATSRRKRQVHSASTWSGTTGCQVEADQQEAYEACPLRSRKVEAIQVHHLVPGRHEVIDELLLRVRAPVDFRQGAEL